MSPEKIERPDSRPQHSDLLQSARSSALKASSPGDLLALISFLEVACEQARVAALRNVVGSGQRVGRVGEADGNCGFAELFAALRSTRAEIKRRDMAQLNPITASSGDDCRATSSQPYPPERASLARRKAPE